MKILMHNFYENQTKTKKKCLSKKIGSRTQYKVKWIRNTIKKKNASQTRYTGNGLFL